MLTRQAIIKATQEFVESAKKNNLTIEKILLFGSYAKGNLHEYSDIDLAIFSKQFSDNPFENIKMIQTAKRLPQMQLHLYPFKEFEKDPFVNEIKKHAINIPIEIEHPAYLK
jgi:uncharacterized protein